MGVFVFSSKSIIFHIQFNTVKKLEVAKGCLYFWNKAAFIKKYKFIVFFMTPISPPPKFLEPTQSLISKYTWITKRARIKSSI